MSRPFSTKYSGILAIFTSVMLLASCGGSSSSQGTSGTNGAHGTIAYAAGVGGAGQTSAAQFLVAVQLPGGMAVATMVNSGGMLTQAQVTLNPQGAQIPTAMTGAIDPSGTYFYEAVQTGLWAFTINRQNGDLTEMSASPYDGSTSFDAVAVDELGKFVYAYSSTGTVYGYSIQPGTGQLSAIAGSPFTAASSGPQFNAQSDRFAFSQDDKYLYVATDAGIVAYSVNASTGALTTVSGSPFGASAGNGVALVAPSSGFLYETINSGKPPGIYGYSIDSSTGALTALSGSPFGGSCGAFNPTSPANGKFLFGTGCGMYQIDASTGALTLLSADPEAANSDSWAVFDPTSAFVWIVTTQAPCFQCVIGVVTYKVDANTGQMTLVPNSFLNMTNSEFGAIGGLAITH